jgi:formylglycine-generating enzyme required for sulfatase activity
MVKRRIRDRKQQRVSRPPSGKSGRATRTILVLLALSVTAGAGWWLYVDRYPTPSSVASVASFQPTVENTRSAPGKAPDGMVWIPGGELSMGAAEVPGMNMVGMEATTDSRPIHRVYVDGFWMDKTVVTNAQFTKFVEATGYVTIAERTPRAEDFPGAPPENLVAGAVVFSPPGHPVPLNDHLQWWSYVKRANWRHPEGPDSNLAGRDEYPVVQVAYDDAVAFATWAGKRLPTEAEWEFAARGGLSGKLYAWGDEFTPSGHWMANTFQGHFPDKDTGEDGHQGIGPVAQFPPNGYGLYDVAGNVWEWMSDWYRPDYYAQLASAGSVARNPHGPDTPFDPSEPTEKKRVHRGGSFLCTDQYCSRYMVGTRGKGEGSTGTNHVGFRLVKMP